MATLTENVAKVAAARDAIAEKIADMGVTVPEGTKLSGMPALIGELSVKDTSEQWGRPRDWPRIDLIPMRGLDTGTMYFILLKPHDTAHHGFALTITTGDAKPWYMERVTVSDSGLSVAAVDGTVREFASGATGAFEFPEDDPEGAVYAVRVRATEGGALGQTSLAGMDGVSSVFFSSSVIGEAIVRPMSTGTASLAFSSGTYGFTGPEHIVYYKAVWVSQNGFRGNTNLRLVEFREGSRYLIAQVSATPSFTNIAGPSMLTADWDDDTEIKFAAASNFSMRAILPRRDGTVYPLSKVLSAGKTTPFDWSTTSVSWLFSGNSLMREVELPAGFGSGGACSSVFSYCTNLQRVALPAGFGSNAASLSNLFRSCYSLTELELPEGCGGKALNVMAFYECTGLVTLTLPEGFGQAVTSTSGTASMFYGCVSLANLNRAPACKASFSLSGSQLSHESLVNVVNTLATVETKCTLTLGSSLLAKLTDEEKKVATDKGWTLA